MLIISKGNYYQSTPHLIHPLNLVTVIGIIIFLGGLQVYMKVRQKVFFFKGIIIKAAAADTLVDGTVISLFSSSHMIVR